MRHDRRDLRRGETCGMGGSVLERVIVAGVRADDRRRVIVGNDAITCHISLKNANNHDEAELSPWVSSVKFSLVARTDQVDWPTDTQEEGDTLVNRSRWQNRPQRTAPLLDERHTITRTNGLEGRYRREREANQWRVWQPTLVRPHGHFARPHAERSGRA